MSWFLRNPSYNRGRYLSYAGGVSFAACLILGTACKSPRAPSNLQSDPTACERSINRAKTVPEAPVLQSSSASETIIQSPTVTPRPPVGPVPTSPSLPATPASANQVPNIDNEDTVVPTVSMASTSTQSASPAVTSSNKLAQAALSTTPSIRLVIAGVRPEQGSVKVAIYTTENEFPNPLGTCQTFELATTQATIEATLPVSDRFAVGIYQDINGDGELNRNRLGIPTEPFAFSNNAIGKRGPPSFDQAAIDLKTANGAGREAPLTVSIKLP